MQYKSACTSLDRRHFLLTLAGGCALVGTGMLGLHGCSQSHSAAPLSLPPLPYGMDALEPHISRKTLEFHYGKHHKAYVDKTNELIAASKFAGLPLEEIVKQTANSPDNTALFNNAAQAWNHDFYWKCMRPGGSKPNERLTQMMAASFGNQENLKKELQSAALAQFGSGWAWLVLEGDKLKVTKTPNADTPIAHGQTPLFTIDVWEHAYYLDYQNRRADYVSAVLNHLLNWEFAASQLPKA